MESTISTKKRMIAFMMAMMLIFSLFSFYSVNAFADEEGAAAGLDASAQEITEGVTNGLDKAYGILKAIALPIAVICLVIAGIKMFGSTKAMDEGKAIIVRVAIAMAVIYLGPLIVNAIRGWFGTYNISGVKGT